MAIKKKITFEGNTYHLGNKDRVAAHAAQDHVTDSYFKYITSTGNVDYSALGPGHWTIMVNVALADGNYIRLPEATTSNGGTTIKVIFGLAPADNAVVGYKTSLIVGGATSISDGTEGLAGQGAGIKTAASGDAIHSLALDIDGAAGDGSGSPGTILEFFYPGVDNVVLYRGNLMGKVDSVTLANHYRTAEVDA
tara:strand:+ start:174 stop:755 length:582 start_codon:yes stop_codon:yes gene_type:complete